MTKHEFLELYGRSIYAVRLELLLRYVDEYDGAPFEVVDGMLRVLLSEDKAAVVARFK
jgi:hypothetical protein